MKRLRIFLIASALLTAGSALATAQPFDHDHDGRGDRDRYERRDRDDRRFRDRDDSWFRDRDDYRFRDRDDYRRFDRDDYRSYDRDDYRGYDRDAYFVGERRFFNGFYWTWDGSRWCRRDGGVTLYFGF